MSFVATQTLAQNGSLDFDGADDYVSISSDPDIDGNSHSQRTVEVWFNVVDASINTRKQVIYEQGGGTNGMNMYLFGGSLYMRVYNGGGGNYAEIEITGITSNTWNHAAFVIDGTNPIAGYLNGTATGTTTTGGTAIDEQTSGTDGIGVGGINGAAIFHDNLTTQVNSANGFDGKIDELRIWNTARTATEINANKDSYINSPPVGLVAYYIFDATSGTALTNYGSANPDANGTLNNFALTGTSSNWTTTAPTLSGISPAIVVVNNHTLNFDGDDDIVEVPNTNALNLQAHNEKTIEVWFKAEDAANSSRKQVIYEQGGNVNGINLYVYDSKLYMRVYSSANDYQIETSGINSNQWYHAAFVIDGTVAKGYLDGNEITGGVGSVNGQTRGPNNIAIGNLNSQAVFHDGVINKGNLKYGFDGEIDELRIWNVARSCKEIKANKDNYIGTPYSADLVAYFSFDQATAAGANAGETTLTDKTTGNTHNSTLKNFNLTGTTSNWVSSGNGISGTTPLPQPEIDVLGNATSIADGDTTPDTGDDTDFGQVNNGSSSPETFTIKNDGTANLDVSTITVSSSVFAVSSTSVPLPTTIAPGGTITFSVTFSPTEGVEGVKTGTVSIGNTDCNESSYEFRVQGTEIDNTNKALDFDGTNDHVSIPALNLNSNTVTIEAWIKPDGTQGAFDGIVFSRTANTQAGLNFNGGGNKIGYHWNNNDGATWGWADGPTYTPNEWQHVALVIEPTKATIYLNGIEGGVNNIAHIAEEFDGITEIGVDNLGGRYFNGEIDEVRIWSKARTCAEIQSTMQRELVGNEADLVAYYNFNQGIAGGNNTGITTLNDKTGSNDGTLNNFTRTGTTSNFVKSTANGVLTDTSPIAAAEINVVGNSVSIVDGDLTPSTVDNTDFGGVVGSRTVTYTVQNLGAFDLNIASIVLGGTNPTDFSVSSFTPIVTENGAISFDVTFTAPATTIGNRTATITINTNDCDERAYNFSIQGRKQEPSTLTITCPSDANLTEGSVTCFSDIFKYYPTVTTNAPRWQEPIAGFTLIPGTPASGVSAEHSYYISDGTANYLTARQAALDAGGYLVIIDDAVENTFLTSYISGASIPYALIGMDDIDVEGTFEWNTGQAIGYTNWEAGEPNDFGAGEDAGTLKSNGFWNDLPDNSVSHRYIVEIPRAKVTQTAGLPTASRFPIGTTTNTFVVTDTNGNTETCSFDVTVTSFIEIDVFGNSNEIVNGDTSPNTSDDTDFGSSPSGTTITRTFTITNNGSSQDLNIASIVSSNTTNFAVSAVTPSSTIPIGGNGQFTVTFTPSATTGTTSSTITIVNDDCNETTYTFDVQGRLQEPVGSTLAINCPSDIILNSVAGECGVPYKYYPEVTTNAPRWTDPIDGFTLVTFSGGTPSSGSSSGHSYYISNGTDGYIDARQKALEAGGHLLVIDDAAENDFIRSYINSLGLSHVLLGYDDIDVEGTFEWYTGQPTGYTNWAGGEPNDWGSGEDAATIRRNGTWNDLPRNRAHRYIVEIPAAKTIQTTGLPTCSTFPVGTTTNTFVTTDMNGNTVTCSFTVTVRDTEKPVLTNPSLAGGSTLSSTAATATTPQTFTKMLSGTTPNCAFVNTATDIIDLTATDNCGINSSSIQYELTGATTATVTTLVGQQFEPGITNVIVTVRDVNGNSSIPREFEVRVEINREISISGNNVVITNGDNTPDVSDDTDMGVVTSAGATKTFTIKNLGFGAGAADLSVSSVSSDNAQFTISGITTPTTINAGNETKFDVVFTPTSSGTQTATITVASNDCDEGTYTFRVSGNNATVAPPTPTPSLPSNGLRATTISATQVNLNWFRTGTNVSEYILYINGVRVATLPAGTTSYEVTGLAPDEYHSFRLETIDRTSGRRIAATGVAKAWTLPLAPTLLSLPSPVCNSGRTEVRLASSSYNFRVYSDSTSSVILMTNINGRFLLPTVSETTTFYIAAVGRGRTEGRRTPVLVEVVPSFKPVILGDSIKTSCENSIELVAEEVPEATDYRWNLNGQPYAQGVRLVTSRAGIYTLWVRRGGCSSVSEQVVVRLNQRPVAQIRQVNNFRFCEEGVLSAVFAGSGVSYRWLMNNTLVGEEQTLVIKETATYTLVVERNGCQDSTKVEAIVSTFDVEQTPVLEATNEVFCQSDSTVLSVQNPIEGVSYQWYKNGRILRGQVGQTFTTNKQGIYQVRAVADVNPSCGKFSDHLWVKYRTVEPIYLRWRRNDADMFLEDIQGTQDLIVDVEWYHNGEVISEFGSATRVTPTEPGYYSAKVTNIDGCIWQTRTIYFVMPTPVITGEEDADKDTFSVYPNPSTGIFHIRFGAALLENTNVTVFDGIGRNVHAQVFEKSQQEFVLDLSKMSKGAYLIHFNQNGSTFSKQVIVK